MSVFVGPVVNQNPRVRTRAGVPSRLKWYERPRYRYPLWALLSVAMVAGGLSVGALLWRVAQSVDTTSILTWFVVTAVAFMPVVVAMAGCALPVLVAMRFRDRVFRKFRREPELWQKILVWVWASTQLIALNAVMLYYIVQFR
ncbi:MAG: hypothetical protein AAGI68_08685 [Planctomycetota bacterium]